MNDLIIDDIAMKFGSSPKVYFGENLDEKSIFDGDHVELGFAPWPSQPDLLCSNNIFCGITYNVGSVYLDEVKILHSRLGSDRVRLVQTSDVNYYADHIGLSASHYLEVIWTNFMPDQMIFGALCEDVWFYKNNHVLGVMLAGITRLSADFGLSPPAKEDLFGFGSI